MKTVARPLLNALAGRNSAPGAVRGLHPIDRRENFSLTYDYDISYYAKSNAKLLDKPYLSVV